MESERFEMRVPGALLLRVDEARGHESRASFFRRAAVEKLNGAAILRGGEATFPVSVSREIVEMPPAEFGLKFSPEEDARHREAERAELARQLVPAASLVGSGGCPECGGQWQRRPDVPGRFCVDCGGREAK